MKTYEKENTRQSWKTIDYIGGGFVLQAAVDVTILETYRRTATGTRKFQSSKVTSVSDKMEIDMDVSRLENSRDRTHINGIAQPHRVVHISELAGVDMGEFMQEVEERGGLK